MPGPAAGHDFCGGLISDVAGNLYGTTIYGGHGGGCEGGYGTVFQLTPTSSGTWKEGVLHSFQPDQYNRCSPGAGVVMDSAGNLYGTTGWGGTGAGGTVLEITPQIP